MNSKRRAELQRKLTLNAVPRPPAGLAERIKADIPQYLEAETMPQRFTRLRIFNLSTFNLRIAASFIVLAGAVLVAMVVSRSRQEKLADTRMTTPVIFAPAPRAMTPADTTTTVAAVARTEEVQLDIVQEVPPMVAPQVAVARVAPPAMVPAPESRDDETDAQGGVEGEAAYGVAGGVVGGRAEEVRDAEPRRLAEYAPEVAAAAAPPSESVPAAPAPASAPSLAQANETRADAAGLDRRQERAAAKVMTEQPRQREAKKDKNSVFGISVSPQVFNDIRSTIQSGQRPAASAVDVEALVNYFAGPPPRAPRRVSLEVEASPAVIPAEGEHAVLRFTIDTPAGSGIAASDARIEVVINDDAVARATRIGDADPLARESVLPYGTSVTGLYALEMKRGLRSSQLVATVHLHYTIDGKPATITKVVEGHDLEKSWGRSSRRHRLASLGAVWAESLKGTPAGSEVLRRAEELATQDPGDVHARELARAVSASAAGGR